MLPFHVLPNHLVPTVRLYWQRISESDEFTRYKIADLVAGDAKFAAQLCRNWSCSEFLADSCIGKPSILLDLHHSTALKHPQQDDLKSLLKKRLAPLWQLDFAQGEGPLKHHLRQFRQAEMLRILWLDLSSDNNKKSLINTCEQLSKLADVCIEQSLNLLYHWSCQEWGTPYGKGLQQHLVVLAMGKLGANELNVSSDIDLIFSYPEAGKTQINAELKQGSKEGLSNQEFFIRLAQRLIAALDSVTAEGFVFRVDMRLRPYGGAGALVLSFDAMEEYYQNHGRDWERYAMIKARAVCGDIAAGESLLRSLSPFIYRRYLDFAAIDALREMKNLINRQVRRKGLGENVKLGSGGIREIEFIVQSVQLIHGGRDNNLQQQALFKVLPIVKKEQYLPLSVVDELEQAYIFLRHVEHKLQAYLDRQTQTLPRDKPGRLRIAWAMGYESWADFAASLEYHRSIVRQHFHSIVAKTNHETHKSGESSAQGKEPSAQGKEPSACYKEPSAQGKESSACYKEPSAQGKEPSAHHKEPSAHHKEQLQQWSALWLGDLEPQEAIKIFTDHGYESAKQSWTVLTTYAQERQVLQMQRESRLRLDKFIPLLLQALPDTKHPSLCLARILKLVEAVTRRTAYLVLLMENPKALRQLIKLCEASPWIAEYLALHPVLLDELISDLITPADRSALQDELRQQMLRIARDDYEQQMEALRYFKQAHVLQAAAGEVNKTSTLMKVSDYLTAIAEVILEQVLLLSWQHLVDKHGHPPKAGEKLDATPNFAIVAYGKLGGIELNYDSDLDIVFLHDNAVDTNADAGTQATDGQRAINCREFYARLGQRRIHTLTTYTMSGILYEVDVRLRPSGASGLLVSTIDAFEKYQYNDAWTWEHQALVRSRVVAGSSKIAQKFASIRAAILSQRRDLPTLRKEVRDMRKRMHDELEENKGNTVFDLKQGSGGIVDIEFVVQYSVLAWSSKFPALSEYTDNIRLLKSAQEAGLLQAEEAQVLTDAYLAFRAAIHSLALQSKEKHLSREQFVQYRRRIEAIWIRLIELD